MNHGKKSKDSKPTDQSPSSFVLSCVNNHKLQELDGMALDLACGFGRHTILLNSKGYTVVSGDLSMGRLHTIKDENSSSYCLCLDASKNLPFQDQSFNLVVIVHFVHECLLSNIQRLIVPGGFLIYETYGGQGDNWHSLSKPGDVENELSADFTILTKRQRYVGPKDDPHVSLKIFAQKK
jgi:SAM-dependent methyltransferase